jgi:hypothetical protein
VVGLLNKGFPFSFSPGTASALPLRAFRIRFPTFVSRSIFNLLLRNLLLLNLSGVPSPFRVPSQPRLLTESDYCYSGRLHTLIQDLFCNPWLSGFACYSRTFRLSFLRLARDSGTGA